MSVNYHAVRGVLQARQGGAHHTVVTAGAGAAPFPTAATTAASRRINFRVRCGNVTEPEGGPTVPPTRGPQI